MKILHLTSTFLPAVGGAEICIANLIREQVGLGHDVRLLVPFNMYRRIKDRFSCRIHSLLPYTAKLTFRLGWLGSFYGSASLYRLYLKHGFDILHTHFAFPTGYLSVPFLRFSKVPSVLTCHGVDIQKIAEYGYGVRLDHKHERSIQIALETYNYICAISASVKKEIISFNVPTSKIVNIPNGVSIARFLKKFDKESIRQAFSLPMDKKILLTVGRNHPKKGFKYILAAAKIIIEYGETDFLWLIVGKDTLNMAGKIKDLNLQDHVETRDTIAMSIQNEQRDCSFSYPSDDLISLYQAADVFVFPTLMETFGMVVIEAMAAGIPVVTTSAPGPDEIINNGFNGLKVTTRDPKSMAHAILKLLRDQKFGDEIARNALTTVKRYDWMVIAKQYLDVYYKAIEKRKSSKS